MAQAGTETLSEARNVLDAFSRTRSSRGNAHVAEWGEGMYL